MTSSRGGNDACAEPASVDPTEARNNQPNQCYSSGFSPASVTHVAVGRTTPRLSSATDQGHSASTHLWMNRSVIWFTSPDLVALSIQ
jgi:hypothetical protein